MTENSMQLQIEKQKKIIKIAFTLKMFFLSSIFGSLFFDIAFMLLLMLSKDINKINLIFMVILPFSIDFLLVQWCISYHILNFSSVQFIRKNKILFFTYNILTLNILGIILGNKALKGDNYNCVDLTEEKDFENDEKCNNKMTYSSYKRMTILINILLIVLAFAYIW